jgi:hypothetical protein
MTNNTTHISGSFDVKVLPQEPSEKVDPPVGRMLLDKHFHGALEGPSKGEMLASSNAANGSAAYVALERVTAVLEGREGTFVLMHNGTMNREGQALRVTVAKDSGTGQLEGIAGEMKIIITDKKHFYEFDYTLPATSPPKT